MFIGCSAKMGQIWEVNKHELLRFSGMMPGVHGCFQKSGIPQNGWWKSWKTLLKWMIGWFGGTPIFWKHPHQQILPFSDDLLRYTSQTCSLREPPDSEVAVFAQHTGLGLLVAVPLAAPRFSGTFKGWMWWDLGTQFFFGWDKKVLPSTIFLLFL